MMDVSVRLENGLTSATVHEIGGDRFLVLRLGPDTVRLGPINDQFVMGLTRDLLRVVGLSDQFVSKTPART